MNKSILNSEVQNYLSKNLNVNLNKLVFKKSPFQQISIQELVQQIEGKLKAKNKLPTWFNTSDIYYPPKINLEQTSSEITARYKTHIVSGNSLADLTGGFGVDSYYFSKVFKEVFHFETNSTLSEIAAHNFLKLNSSIKCINKDGIEAMKNETFDCIYIDPSRRHDLKGKVFLLSDCEPDVVKHLDYLLDRSKSILIKTSPMLDIKSGIKELNYVSEIHIVAVENEVKEMLWLINLNSEKDLKIKAVNILNSKTEVFESKFETDEKSEFSLPKKYLYEPNAAIMKSGLFHSLAEKFQIHKLAVNTHLFTSDQLVEFPGRRFEIQKSIPYKKSEIKKYLSGIKANITTRNFPESVETLKIKWNISDGGDNYLFFTTNKNKNRIVLFCRKIKG